MTSNPHWGQKTSALHVAAEFADRIKGRNIIVTGVAPEGVGEGTAIAFASQEPENLILISRTKDKLEAIANVIRTSYPSVNVRTIIMDLASQESIKKAATQVESFISTLDILVNNAGCTYRLRNWTAEGIEMQFGVNHIGTFLLTKLLFPLLKSAATQSPPGVTRVVNLSSHGHMLSPIRFHDYNMENKEIPQVEQPISPILPAFAKASEDGYLSTIAYSQSKTANILFTLYLQHYAGASGIMSYALHPGGVISNLGREHEEDVAEAIAATSKYWKNSDEGASTSLVAALDPSLDVLKGIGLNAFCAKMADLRAPRSPWAVRYGLFQDANFSLVRRDNLAHSGLAPLHPMLDPAYYDAEPSEDEFEPPATYQELDELLATEEFQRMLLRGQESWTLGPFNGVLSLWGENQIVLGGHQPDSAKMYPKLFKSYMEERIEVNPAYWMPCFQKDHWYDLVLAEPDYIEEADGTKSPIYEWSVDNDRVWNELSFIIEIANRIFLALIRDNNTWLGTLLYGRIQRWYEIYGDPNNAEEHKMRGEDKKILLTPSIERSECAKMNRPFLGQDIEPDAGKREQLLCAMLTYHNWSFSSGFSTANGDTSQQGQATFSRMNAALVKSLCYGNITIAERCVLYVRQAKTMLPAEDELMHALFMLRVTFDPENISPELVGDIYNEPYVNGEPVAELGCSFEAAVFGGTPEAAPHVETKYLEAITLIATSIGYPSKFGTSTSQHIDTSHPAMKIEAPVKSSYLPAALLWRLQSKHFWDAAPPNGENGFLFPRVFNSVHSISPSHQKMVFSGISIEPEFDENGPFRAMIDKFNERLQLWRARRPWYALAMLGWHNLTLLPLFRQSARPTATRRHGYSIA
ncbi:hypothetical protein E0Z10_g6259 [Xylaria hypoxylon]|uniref:Uncharacterized protein n=1 Tax=Xylaria hypoxylon TaxID=37992 RepID=A0A4Z0YTP7_9PEZI|nr:hypothetical protein E0Z10_g6259 [Xylaria hypoxylon]